MSTRSVRVLLEAQVAQYERNMGRAKVTTDKLGEAASAASRKIDQSASETASASQQTAKASQDAARAHEEAAKAAEERADSLATLGEGLAAFGAVTVAALGFAAKAAIDWETAWAGVTKTVDGSPEQMAALEEELRGLAKTLPATHEEIAGVAEAAGQLGVAREDISAFTKTMIDLGETTNLTAEEAATSIAQMMNVMQTAPEDVDNLGSALVALGNDGASTEKEILEMAQRIAGTGKLIGASEGEVLALSNALSSLGIRAEAGGSAASRILQDLYTVVESGGPKLEAFAEVAGMSAQQFATAFKTDPIGAMDAFTQGLNRIQSNGGNVVGVLKNLGITSTEDTRLLLALAGAGDILADSLATQGKAWNENTALVEEARKRYETTAAQIQIAWNTIKDAAIDAGAVILPVVADVVEAVANLAEWFGDLSPAAQGALTGLTGLIGVTALVGGGFLAMLPRINESREALRSLGDVGRKTDVVLGKVGKAAGIAGVALAGLAIAGAVSEKFVSANASVEEFAQALLRASEEGKTLKGVFESGDLFASSNDFAATFAGDINNVGDALARINTDNLFLQIRDGVNELVHGLGIGTSQIKETKESLEGVDSAITSFAQSGNMEQAAKSFRQVAKAAKEQGVGLETTAESFPQYLDHLRGLARDAGVAVSKQELLNWALGKVPPKMQAVADKAANAAKADAELEGSLEDVGIAADGTVESLSEYLDLLFATGLAVMSSRDAQAAYQESLDGVGDAVDEIVNSGGKMGATLNKTRTDFNLTTEAGRLANDAFQSVAQDGMARVKAMAEEGIGQDKIQAKLQGTYRDLIDAAGAFGITGGKAKALAREVLGVPDGVSIKSWMSQQAKKTAQETKLAMFQLPKDVNIGSFMSDKAYRMSVLTKAGINNIPNSKRVKSWMSDNAFIEALQTRAAVLDIPAKDVIDSFMSSAARDEADKTTAEVLGIPEGASISSFMGSAARREAMNLNSWLNKIDGRHTSSKHTHTNLMVEITKHKAVYVGGRNSGTTTSAGPQYNASGGRIPKHADGGRLPLTGPGTDTQDGILGVSSLTGAPVSWLDKGEWIINGRNSDKYDRELAAINAGTFPKLPGYADGGRAGRAVAASNMAPAAVANSAVFGELLEALRSRTPITINGVKTDHTREVVDALNFEIARQENSGKYD